MLGAVLVPALIAALLGVSPHPAHAAKGMEIGLQDDPSFVTQYHLKRKQALKLALKLHGEHVDGGEKPAEPPVAEKDPVIS